MRRYTEEQEGWLRDNYGRGTVRDTLDAFEARFGWRPSSGALYQKAHKMRLEKAVGEADRAARAQVRMRWSSPECAEMREWMLENDSTEGVQATIDAFEARFGIRLCRSQVTLFRSSHGTQKRSPRRPAEGLPVGTERKGRGGLVKVKVRAHPDVPCSKDNWRYKHHLAWEEANGRPVPEGCAIVFADGDPGNCDPGNLVAVPKRYAGQLNNPRLPGYGDAETLRACVALADLRSAVGAAEKGSPRRCGVCGATFTPTEKQRGYRRGVQTCPACLAAGRLAPGVRDGGEDGTCSVCGATYRKSIRTQTRCPGCIAAAREASARRKRKKEDGR